MRIYAYLRASTNEQDANRARASLEAFAAKQGFTVSAWFVENVSGASLKRPELFRMLDITEHGDAILIESVDRITRLNAQDWQQLRGTIESKGIRLISLDMPNTHNQIKTGDDFTDLILERINSIMLDALAAVARKDYESKRKKQAEGVQRAKAEGKYKGRPVDTEKHEHIKKLLIAGTPWKEIERLVPTSPYTIAKVKKSMEKEK